MKDIINNIISKELLASKGLEDSFESILNIIYNDRTILISLLESFRNNRELISLSEHYDFFDKLVLYKDPQDRFRIRLHIFSGEKHNNRPHNHRWNYSTILLNGYYKQYIYGTEDTINLKTDPNELYPILSHDVSLGSCYTLAHNVFHSVDVEPETISLMIRSNSCKSKFIVFDKLTNQKWYEYERESETIEEINRKIITSDQIKINIDMIHKLRVV